MRGAHAVFSTVGKNPDARDDWRTPKWILNCLPWAIGLDPATSEDNPTGARLFFTKETNGLNKSWGWIIGPNNCDGRDECVFLNHPYGVKSNREWSKKVLDEVQTSEYPLVWLCPSRTDQSWWQDAAEYALRTLFISGRLKHDDGGGGAPFPSSLFFFGSEQDSYRFDEAFRYRGLLMSAYP